jgi:tetratricopeptide (TPR) repeat protein
MGDSRGEAWTLDLLGNLKLAQREDAEAEDFYRRAFVLLSQEGLSPLSRGWYGYHQGTLWSFRQEAGRAEAEFLEALGHFEKAKDKLGLAATLIQLGEGACLQKNFSSSRRYFQRAVGLCLQARLLPFLADGITGVARLLKAEGDERQAISFLMVALSHPTCRRQTKDRAVAFSLELQSHFPPQEVEGAAQWAKAARLEDVAASWLSANSALRAGKKRPAKKAKPKRPRKPRKAPKKKRR